MWNTIKGIVWKYGGSLVTDAGNNGNGAVVSLGRVSFLVLFGLAFWMWYNQQQLPGDMFSMLLTLAGYNLGSKLVQTTKEILTSRQAPPAAPPAPAAGAPDANVAG